MAKIVISSTGTYGDHLPYIALGEALKNRGHRVIMAFRESMHPYVIKAGLEAISCGQELLAEEAREKAGDWDELKPPSSSFEDQLQKTEAMLTHDVPQIFQTLEEDCQNAVLFIGGLQRQLFGAMLEQKIGLKWVAASVTPAFQCSEIGQQRLSNDRNFVMNIFIPTLKEIFIKLGVKEINWFEYEKTGRSLLGASPIFAQPLPEFSQYQATGFWLYRDPDWDNWQPSPQLRAFVESDPAPLYLSFSSIPVVDPRSLLQVHVEAAKKLGRKLLVHRGWANFNESLLPDDCDQSSVMFVDFMPQDWLLSHCAVFLHHGGIGTIARSLWNNCPMIVEPLGNDQFFNAKRVISLKIGTAVHPHKITGDSLARIIENKILSKEIKEHTEELGAKIRAEKGTENAANLIDSWLT
jgi:UDP:flavonoid glycosyltransferase YjiC (YdhE family)